MLTLSFLPCADSLAQEFEPQHATEQVQVDQNQDQHAGHSSDQCSPMCTCACCGVLVPIAINPIWAESNLIELVDTYIPKHTFDYSFEFTEGIWHPPAHC